MTERSGPVYDPQRALRALAEDPGRHGARFDRASRECAEMFTRAEAVLAAVMDIRRAARVGGPRDPAAPLARVPLRTGDDEAGAILARAQGGANGGRCTKSKFAYCTARPWQSVMEDFGLRGFAGHPTVGAGSWWMGLLSGEYDDWRQDYLALLDYNFYLEYNVDTALAGPPGRFVQDVLALWDLPDAAAELLVRREHTMCSLAYFDAKRRHEAALSEVTTDGLSTWVHRDRDLWRDYTAADSGIFGHYLSFAQGPAGRDDMMLTRLVNDWVDLGPDLRYDECNQGVLALTRGSVALPDLLAAHERTVWMLNAQWTPEGRIRPDRYAGCVLTAGTCMWQLVNHRQDVWRYYALAAHLADRIDSGRLARAGQVADCYTPDLYPTTPANPTRLRVPRRPLPYRVTVEGREFTGTVDLHTAVCDAVDSGILPMGLVDNGIVVPGLLRERRISAPAFLAHMDRTYCDHLAWVVRSGHTNGFSRAYGTAVAALVMEQWWRGTYLAVGVGSLIDAQPATVAGDRPHRRTHPSPTGETR
ncbi:hypothetical protein [Kitasatospora albolonga]|uniref:hypothetical protein n=2 Tax=Kitasatospora albolonga TaxID=68173 RepID=UPI0031EFECC7